MNSSSCSDLNSAKLNNNIFIALTPAVTFLGQVGRDENCEKKEVWTVKILPTDFHVLCYLESQDAYSCNKRV